MFSFMLNMLTQRREKCTFRKLIYLKFVLAKLCIRGFNLFSAQK